MQNEQVWRIHFFFVIFKRVLLRFRMDPRLNMIEFEQILPHIANDPYYQRGAPNYCQSRNSLLLVKFAKCSPGEVGTVCRLRMFCPSKRTVFQLRKLFNRAGETFFTSTNRAASARFRTLFQCPSGSRTSGSALTLSRACTAVLLFMYKHFNISYDFPLIIYNTQ